MNPFQLTEDAAKECLQMIVWEMAEEDWTPDTLDTIMSTLVEYGIAENPDDHLIDDEDWEQ